MIEHIKIPELEKHIGERKPAWSDKEIAILTKYYNLGVPVREIAKYLKKSEDSVRHKAKRLGLI